jgi:vanillate O-demethylase monooxygenase subunit
MYAKGWYVCAMSDELGNEPIGRMILEQPVVIWRDGAGKPVVLEDRCVHRRLPLSKGRLVDGRLQCGYHGLEYVGSGQCVRIPGQDNVPPRAQAKSYPVAEGQGWIFAWIGDPADAAATPVPNVAEKVGAPGWRTIRGRLPIKCNHLLVLDNLLDLSHLAYVHGTITGNVAVAENARVETKVNGNRVRVTRVMEDVEAAMMYAEFGGFDRLNRWQLTEYIPPCYYFINNGSEQVSAGPVAPERVDGQAEWGFQVYHGITPENRNTTHQFWQISYPESACPANRLAEFDDLLIKVLYEDLYVYEAQQESIELIGPEGRDGEVNPVIAINADAGLNQARQILQRLSRAV